MLFRHFRKSNFNVLHQWGWDSFECLLKMQLIKTNFIKNGTYENIDYMRDELKALGLSFHKLENLQQVMNYIQMGNKSSL